ncbi:MAG: FliA/WhiG family RNA polymerase sigma factor [Phycisphaerales bacterium]|nr:MAG: FliA/WhiG family RNA polymerase sigma factor [Phycisphaerales bacterium]
MIDTKNICEEPLTRGSQKHLSSVALRAYSGEKKSVKSDAQNERIAEFLPMVRKIAGRVITYLKPPLSFEDMVSAGTVGLVRAARDFDPSHQAEFKTYAYIRIKGAILDELRGWSFVPANLSKRIRDAQQLSRKITEQRGTAPGNTELAEKLGISIEELYEIFDNARAQYFLSLDGFGEGSPALGNLLAADDASDPDRNIERAELIEKLTEAIQGLSARQRQVVLLYYRQQLTMKQVAEILEITESRVSQLHASALFNLSVRLRQWKDGRL